MFKIKYIYLPLWDWERKDFSLKIISKFYLIGRYLMFNLLTTQSPKCGSPQQYNIWWINKKYDFTKWDKSRFSFTLFIFLWRGGGFHVYHKFARNQCCIARKLFIHLLILQCRSIKIPGNFLSDQFLFQLVQFQSSTCNPLKAWSACDTGCQHELFYVKSKVQI